MAACAKLRCILSFRVHVKLFYHIVTCDTYNWFGSCVCYQEVKDHEDAKKIHEMKGASMVRRL